MAKPNHGIDSDVEEQFQHLTIDSASISSAANLQLPQTYTVHYKKPGGGKALLFEKPTINGKVSQFPLAINALGSKRRMAMALGLGSVDELASQREFLMKAKPPKSFKDAMKLLRNGIDLIHARPRTVKSAPCQEVVNRTGGGESRRTLFPGPSSDPQVLASGWRTLHHASDRLHQGS